MRIGLVLTMAVAACGSDPTGSGDATSTTTRDTTQQEVVLQDPGIIALAWTLPGDATCETTTIDSLVMRVYLADSVVDTLSGPCIGDSGTMVMANLQPGRYDVQLDGRDAQTTAIYRGTVAGVVVASNETAEKSTMLAQLPASLDVAWELDGVECGADAVVEVELVVFYDAQSTPIEKVHDTSACDEGDHGFDDLEPNQDVAVVGHALNADGDVIAEGQAAVGVLGPGQSKSVTVTLEAN